MNDAELENLEIDLLLEAVFQCYGHDLRQYARASVARRIRRFLAKSSHASPAALIPVILHDEAVFRQFISGIAVPVTEMFRDPEVYRSLRENVVPLLKTYPFIKVWHAGCATGEEVYSLAILLKEADLYERATLYATDFSDEALRAAREGVYPRNKAEEFASAYREAGGTRSLSDYYQAGGESIAIHHDLARHREVGQTGMIVKHWAVCLHRLSTRGLEWMLVLLRLEFDD